MGVPVEVMFVFGVEGKGSKLEVIDGRDKEKGRSSWKWALDCHKITSYLRFRIRVFL